HVTGVQTCALPIWIVEYGPVGFTLGAGNDTAVNVNFLMLKGLTQGTFYEFYVRDVCSPTDSSFWSGPYSFLTTFPPGIPTNDTCANAIDISDGKLYAGDNSFATETLAPCDGTSAITNDMWYKFTTTSAGTVMVEATTISNP